MVDFGARLHALRTAEPLHDKWWLTLLAPYVVLVVIGGLVLNAPLVTGPVAEVSRIPWLLVAFVGSLPVSIPGLYFDILYVAEVSEWRPSMWYSLLLFTPYVGWLILAVYLLRRWKYVGL